MKEHMFKRFTFSNFPVPNPINQPHMLAVMWYNMKDLTLDEMNQIWKAWKNSMPDGVRCCAMPSVLDLEILSLEQLIEIRNSINLMIDSIKQGELNDTNTKARTGPTDSCSTV